MTTEIKVGPELDALVAEKVMGIEGVELGWLTWWADDGTPRKSDEPSEERGAFWPLHPPVDNDTIPDWTRWDPVPFYSTTYEGAGLVIERMRELGWWFRCAQFSDGFRVVFERHPATEVVRWNVSLPEAVCRAALAAMEASGG